MLILSVYADAILDTLALDRKKDILLQPLISITHLEQISEHLEVSSVGKGGM